MLSEIIHTPEFAAPLPRWMPGASLALITLLAATRLMLPAENTFAALQSAEAAKGASPIVGAEFSAET
jgi:hypothetical protein